MHRLSDRFADAAAACDTMAGLGALLDDAVLELGFCFYALLDHASLACPSRFIRLDNYPAGWAAELVESGMFAEDPVHLASRRADIAFAWTDLDRLIAVTGLHRRILARSQQHGLGAGFTIPGNAMGEPSSSCSFAVSAGDELPLDRLDCAELIGHHALSTAHRLRQRKVWPDRPSLTPRQIQCVRLVARGKTDWEIATILGLSPETVRQYVKQARRLYDVATRTQLAIAGLRDAWIDFTDAIPPSG